MSQKFFKTKAGTELPLLDLRGKPYLQVPHRIQWCREEHPDWLFEVDFKEITDEHVFAKAIIKDGEGKILAIAHKVEHFSDFKDAIEKCETSSIGRALAMLGYGTQFAAEFDEEDRLADAPIPPAKPAAKPTNYAPQNSNGKITQTQAAELQALAVTNGYSKEQIQSILKRVSGAERWSEVTNVAFPIIKGNFSKKPEEQ
jgi:hypothetical protein